MSPTPLYDGKPIEHSLLPVRISKADHEKIKSDLTQLLSDIEKFCVTASKDSKVLLALGLPTDVNYESTTLGLHIPFCRFDFLWDGKDVKVLELNTDGTSGYNVMEWLGVRAGIENHRNPNLNLSTRLLEALQKHDPKSNEVVVLDFPDVKTLWEQNDLVSFWKKTVPCHTGSPLARSWREGALVYRRALGWELRARREECRYFLEDWKTKNIHVVGGWSSDIGMSKVWPHFVKSPLTPETLLVGKSTSETILNNFQDWVLKAALSNSGKGVISGVETKPKQWEAALNVAKSETEMGRPWVAQRRVDIPTYEGKPLELGMYFLNGVSSVYMARWGHGEHISDNSRERLRPIEII